MDQNIKALTTDVEQITSDSPIKLYPNPTDGIVQFKTDEPLNFVSIRIFGMDGRLVKDIPFSQSIDLKAIDLSGLYILHVVSKEGTLYMDKVIVK